MAISKKIRFEVFKRDSFTCQYCGMAAPDVILHVDHIDPKSKGGEDGILNLLTSCFSCNSGKGARPLSDTTALQKRKAMLDALQERREQIELMLKWQRELEGNENHALQGLHNFWEELTDYRLSQKGIADLKKWLKKFGVQEISEAMRIATRYLEYKEGVPIPIGVSVGEAFASIPGICVNERRISKDPRLKVVLQVKAIARKNIAYMNDSELEKTLLLAVELGVDQRDLFHTARESTSWTKLNNSLATLISKAQED